jgi:hypothetical protein
MKNGDMPAAPLKSGNGALWNLRDGHEDSDFLGQPNERFSIGLTKREMFAMAAMQGLCSTSDLNGSWRHDAATVAIAAANCADALLAELERTNGL